MAFTHNAEYMHKNNDMLEWNDLFDVTEIRQGPIKVPNANFVMYVVTVGSDFYAESECNSEEGDNLIRVEDISV